MSRKKKSSKHNKFDVEFLDYKRKQKSKTKELRRKRKRRELERGL